MTAQAVAHERNVDVSRTLEAKETIKCAAEYRPLANEYSSTVCSDWAERRQCLKTGHLALYSRIPLKGGQPMCDFTYRAMRSYPTYLTVCVGDDKHIELSPTWLEHINHSCEPNVFFNTATYQLEALRDIAPGEELCFFYPSTEWEMDSPFQCRCCKPSCVGLIAGASQMSREQLQGRRLTHYIANRLDDAEAAASASASSPSESQ